jgi:hypothetical protein
MRARKFVPLSSKACCAILRSYRPMQCSCTMTSTTNRPAHYLSASPLSPATAHRAQALWDNLEYGLRNGHRGRILNRTSRRRMVSSNWRPHRLEPRRCKPDYSVMVLPLHLDPTLLNHPAEHHFPCRDWEAVGQLPIGQAQMLHNCSLGHVRAFARTSDSHFLAFSSSATSASPSCTVTSRIQLLGFSNAQPLRIACL